MTKTQELISELKSLGLNKYKISKITGATWVTVNYWDKGVHNANPEYIEILTVLLKEKRGEI